MSLQTEVSDLFFSQQNDWTQLREGIQQLDNIREKEFTWDDDFRVKVQFNPARMASTGAAISKKAIEKRPCFLCEANRPAQQKGVLFLEKYIILCNPYPILRNHLTIPLHSHVPQRIRKKTEDMLILAEQLPDYLIFYNGPESGASAPDHFHLQAGLKHPLLMQGDNEFRSCVQIESKSIKAARELFEDLYQFLLYPMPDETEPMMNVIAFTEDNRYKVHIYPRKAHRPAQYFEKGEKQLLVSPGALDMAGVMITVRETDFEKIGKQDIEDIYSQVSLPII